MIMRMNVLQERLQTIDGVSGVQIWGQKRYAMRIWIDPAKLAAYQLTPGDVQAALDKENVELPSGKIAGSTYRTDSKNFGRLITEDDFNNLDYEKSRWMLPFVLKILVSGAWT